ncbi:Beta-1,3-galactosyl-O-glycosyl-glycoprotein beta-1,6-N-acetylglucosaminyltransferase [Bulinus truncatus]|nr:Beta-1,3-galactosyl-O-glycosyl-glycoprotein beta-1,6-N-acetylglucosaminyltransferase [Bulinus truncatus]
MDVTMVTINRPQSYYCVHVDRKSDTRFMESISADVICFMEPISADVICFMETVSAYVICFEHAILVPDRINVCYGRYRKIKVILKMRCKWRKILVRSSLPKLILIVPCVMTVFYVLSNTLNVVPIASRMNKGTSLVKFNREMIGNSTETVRTGRDTNIKISISASKNQLIRRSDQLTDLYRSTSELKQTTSSRRQSNFTCLGRQLDEIEDIFHVPNVNCRKLFSGNHDEIVHAQNYLKTMNITMLSDQFYLNLTTNCELFQKQRGYIMCPLTSEEEDFPIAFTMLAYKDVEMVERLLRSIYRPQNYYCIHVDKKSDEQFMKAVSAIASCFENVFVPMERIDVVWGNYSVLEPELICMKYLWKYSTWKYFINLTGQEFPLKTNWELVQILKAYNGANDVEGTIRRAFVDYVLHNKIAEDLLDWVRPAKVPVETFFTMLNHNPQLGIRGSYKAWSCVYCVTAELKVYQRLTQTEPFLARFKNWGNPPFAYPCAGRFVRLICILTTGDLPILGEAKHLFANKFFLREDPIVIGCLEEMIFNNTRDEFKGDKQFNSTYYSQLGFVLNQVT